jgi:hypothetical protein
MGVDLPSGDYVLLLIFTPSFVKFLTERRMFRLAFFRFSKG